jgi:prepilin-type processing-associated H-X9-DG protein
MGFTYHHANGQPGTASLTPAESMGLNVNFGQSKNGSTVDTSVGWARASSFHPNGMNFVFCDGHVRFLSDTIAYGVFQALMTPRGNASYDNSTGTKFVTTPLSSAHAATMTVDENSLR